MQSPELHIDYALHVEHMDGRVAFSDNASAVFETASAIKSPIGTLAIMKAFDAGIDIDTYTLLVGPEHYSNGSGSIKHEMHRPGQEPKVAKSKTHRMFTLADMLAMNLIDSDCVATNVLIEYVGGKDAINNGLRTVLNLPDMELMADRLLFPGVNHTEVPYQVGKSTMADFTSYYRQILLRDFGSVSSSKAWKEHFDMHARVNTSHMFTDDALVDDSRLVWLNKTGTIVDERPDMPLYVNFADAGIIYCGNTVMAAATALRFSTKNPVHISEEDKRTIEDEYLVKNADTLRNMGLEIPEFENLQATG